VGNHADVLKHWVLFECLQHMHKKPKAFDYIDTHAGAGLYQFNDPKTQKLKEYESGVNRLLASPFADIQTFTNMLSSFTSNGQYPGSPAIVNSMMRDVDKSWLFELHPQTAAEIRGHFESPKGHRKRKTLVRQQDGFEGLNSLLPTASKRALVLIDPSYEIKDDYVNVVKAIEKAIAKMPQTMILLWYPVVDREDVELIELQLLKSGIRNILQLELSIAQDSEQKGMTGSGMIIVNPPWTLKEKASDILPKLAQTLAPKEGTQTIRQLVEE
jgi:23S rRNA (adenine2030-N6)-methyltransferase